MAALLGRRAARPALPRLLAGRPLGLFLLAAAALALGPAGAALAAGATSMPLLACGQALSGAA